MTRHRANPHPARIGDKVALAPGARLGLFGRNDGWGAGAVTCDSGSILGCTIASFPWIIGGLAALVLLLLALRFALTLRDRWRRTPTAPAEPRPPRQVTPGSPLHPPPANETPPKPKAPQPAKPTPLQLQVVDAPDIAHSDFTNTDAQGDFGETLTDIILTLDGWKKVDSRFDNGGQGIDGLFVREVQGGGGFEVLAVETKTNESAYAPASMSDDKLEKDLNALYAQGAFGKTLNEAMAKELIRGLHNGQPFFRKQLWRHSLSNGMTAITPLGRNGEQKPGTMRSHARLISGLYLSLKQLDRRSVYLGQPPVDDNEA